jgi:CelD/BcsL family acetyltransferase involved in cellulose biosynthesis
LHPIFRKGSEAEAAPRLLERILDEPGVELIDLHQIPEDHPWARDTPGTRVLQATCLRIDLPHRFDDYLRGLSKSLRADVRRLDSADFRNGRLRIHRCGVEEADAGLRAFFELHAKRWRRRHLPGAFLGRLVPMHREWAPLAAERGWLRMYVLTLDRRPIGALYGMAMGGTTYFYQSGFDPEHGSRSPGTLLVGHAIREAIAEGHTTFDLMRGDEPYKRRWKPTQESRNFRFLVPGSGLRARLGQIWSLSSFRVEARVRERLETWS